MNKPANRVVYDLPQQEVTFTRLAMADVSDCMAEEHLELIAAVYTDLFENREKYNPPLPAGTIASYYDSTNPRTVDEHRSHILESIEDGSQYWRAYNSGANLLALLKISPSFEHKKFSILHASDNPNLFVNDILVWPKLQGQHIGSAALHLATRFTGFLPEAKAALHTYPNSKTGVNGWYRQLGFVSRTQVKALRIEGLDGRELTVPQTRYVTHRDSSVGHIAARLEDKVASLATATVTD